MLPQVTKADPFEYNSKHLTPSQKRQIYKWLKDYQGALNNGTEIRTFWNFEAVIHLIPGKTAIQPRHNINFHRISHKIAKLEKQGVIEVNTLLDLPTISNLVIINKDTSRLSKAEKYQRKMDKRQAGDRENELPPKYMLTLDLTLKNWILIGNKKVSLHNPAEIIDKISN